MCHLFIDRSSRLTNNKVRCPVEGHTLKDGCRGAGRRSIPLKIFFPRKTHTKALMEVLARTHEVGAKSGAKSGGHQTDWMFHTQPNPGYGRVRIMVIFSYAGTRTHVTLEGGQ